VEQQLPEQSTRTAAETDALEVSLRALWDKARLTAERMGRLREDNRSLVEQVSQLHEQLRRTQQELEEVQEQLKAQPLMQISTAQHQEPMFSNGERQALTEKVKDLLEKLEGYL
jgi:uncharacterized coiled-coil DUF342 family protein